MVYIALAMNAVAFGLIQFVLWMPPAGEQTAFQEVMGLSGLRIFASLTAYLIAQLVAIQVYAALKQWTGQRFLWLRNNGSVCASQIVDTVLIDLIYLYWGLGMAAGEVLTIMCFSYLYKAAFSVINTPFFYGCVYAIRWKLQPADCDGEEDLVPLKLCRAT
jgi:hypothetical protein